MPDTQTPPVAVSGRIAERLEQMPAGSIGEFTIALGNLASGAPIGIPVTIAKGARHGKCLWINGQVHGDEINGVFAALQFVRSLTLPQLCGSIVVTATANPHAFDARRKRTPLDDLDLDQCFPGHAQGLVTERSAAALTAAIGGCADALVSFHTMGSAFDCEPFAVYKLPAEPAAVDERTLLRFIAQFSPRCACWMPLHAREGELPGHLAGALDYWMLGAGKPAFMIELGAGGRIEPRHVRQGVEGLNGVAAMLGLLPSAQVLRPRSVLRVRKYQHVTCNRGGLFRPVAAVDTELQAGQPYGEILDLHGRVLQTLSFPGPVRLVGVRRDPVVHGGDRIAFVAHEWDEFELDFGR